MDKILLGIAASTHTEGVKRAIIDKVITSACKAPPEELVVAVLDISSRWITEDESLFLQQMGRQLFHAWAKHNQTLFEDFFSHRFLIRIQNEELPHPERTVRFVHDGIKMLQNKAAAFKIVQVQVVSLIQKHQDLAMLVEVSHLLLGFPDCFPQGTAVGTLCIAMIENVGRLQVAPSEAAMKTNLEGILHVSTMLHHIWHNNMVTVIPSLAAVFKLISTLPSVDTPSPSVALGALVQHVPVELIATVTKNAALDVSIADDRMTVALTRMIEWLSWPRVQNIDRWIVLFLKNLAGAQKFSILINVTLASVEKVFVKLCFPIARDSALPVLMHMLLSFQHSPEAFHKVVAHVPELIKRLETENSQSSQDCSLKIAELVYCLMHQHAGYPDLYEPVLEALKDIPQPTEEAIKEKLKQNAWTSSTSTVNPVWSSRFLPRSETGKTGLVNLGNTCYMNSVLQALFMTSGFHEAVMACPVYNDRCVVARLQMTFTFLMHTQRAAYSPREFLTASRPPWFSPGTQQDCSEFLKYLLDRLDEEEKAIRTFELGLQRTREKVERMKRKNAKKLQDVVKVTLGGGGDEVSCGTPLADSTSDVKICASLPVRDNERTEKTAISSSAMGTSPASLPLLESAKKELMVVNIAEMDINEGVGDNVKTKHLDGGKKNEQSIGPSIVEEYFAGKSVTRIRCLACNSISSRTETFFDLPLAFPGSDTTSSMRGGESCANKDDTGKSLGLGADRLAQEEIASGSKQWELNGGAVASTSTVKDLLSDPGESGDGRNSSRGSPSSLEELLVHYLTPELLTGDNQYHCEKCRCLRDAEKIIEICKAPKVLVLTLMRFSYDIKTQSRCKILADVKFPKTLNMVLNHPGKGDNSAERKLADELKEREEQDSYQEAPCSKRIKQNSESLLTSDSEETMHKFALYGVVVHSGVSSESGHYYCYARHSHFVTDPPTKTEPANPQKAENVAGDSKKQNQIPDELDLLPDRWFLFNDSRVSLSSYESFGNVTKRFPKDTAYVLFYRQVPGESLKNLSELSPAGLREKPLRLDLQEAISKDNALYLKEREQEARTMVFRTSRGLDNFSSNRRHFDDGNDPPSGCGGGSGMEAPRGCLGFTTQYVPSKPKTLSAWDKYFSQHFQGTAQA